MSTPLRLLILEDRPEDAELMLRELRRAGFVPDWRQVETEADYLAGLDPTLDVILADYNLPQYDAVRALRRLQEWELDVPFIVVTGSISEEVAVECMKQGAADYLLKDRLARLASAVVQALEQRRLRREKREADELLKLQSAVLDAAANAILITDRDGRIAWVNPAFTRLTGYSLTEIWGQNPRFLKSGRQDPPFYRRMWESVLSGQVWHGEVVNRRKDGSLYTEEMTVTPVRDHGGEISHFIAVKQDITERKQATERLARLNRDLRTISLCNQALVRAREEEELLREICRIIVAVGGHRAAWVGLLEEGEDGDVRPVSVVGCEPDRVDRHPTRLTDPALATCPVSLAIRTGMAQVVQNLAANPPRCPWHDEAIRLGFRSSVSLPLNDGERTFGALTIYSAYADAFDSGEVPQLTELANDLAYGIQAIRTRAAHAWAEAERTRLEARLRQQQKLEAIGTLASGVAHEINNPITGIMNYAQLIADAAPGSKAGEYAGEIVRETERVATIVRNLLQFARQEKPSHSRARVADILERTLSLLRAVLRRDQITLEVDVPEDLPSLKCRSQQIQQVLMNLLTNARDALNERYPGYHPDKTIRVTVRPFEQDGRRWLRVTVADQGNGIPGDIRERIFDPFFTTKPRDQGTGLGLSISHGIVKDHQGALHFETEPGVGTQFHLDLPADNGWAVEGK
jgi:PAS domain S-box-containing protein